MKDIVEIQKVHDRIKAVLDGDLEYPVDHEGGRAMICAAHVLRWVLDNGYEESFTALINDLDAFLLERARAPKKGTNPARGKKTGLPS